MVDELFGWSYSYDTAMHEATQTESERELQKVVDSRFQVA